MELIPGHYYKATHKTRRLAPAHTYIVRFIRYLTNGSPNNNARLTVVSWIYLGISDFNEAAFDWAELTDEERVAFILEN